MGVEELQRRLLHHYRIRVDGHMVEYVLRRLEQAGRELPKVPVIGAEARTGAPLRLMVDPATLQSPSSAS